MDHLATDRGGAPTGRWDVAALIGFVIAPLVALAAAIAWAMSMLDRLPDSIATHFGASGEADGFGDPASILLILVAVTVPLVLLQGLPASMRRFPRIVRRTLGPGSPAFAGLSGGLVPDILLPQLDVEPAQGVTVGSTWSIVGTLAGLAIGVATAALLRDVPSPSATDSPDPALPRGPRSDPVSTKPSTGIKVLVAVWFAASLASLILSAVVFLVLILSSIHILQTFVVRLSVDDDSVRIRALIGESIPLESITAARAARYDWGDSGGIGIRGVEYRGTRGKRIAVASRSGEALDIDTTGTNWTIVVPDGTAEALAGDINARLDRLRGRRG